MYQTIEMLSQVIYNGKNEVKELTQKKENLIEQLCATQNEIRHMNSHVAQLESELKNLYSMQEQQRRAERPVPMQDPGCCVGTAEVRDGALKEQR